MKHSIRITDPTAGHVYLSHRGKREFAPATARKYLREWLASNPGGAARIEDQFCDPVPSAARLESRARRLYALRLVDPRAPHYALADSLMAQARAIRAGNPPTTNLKQPMTNAHMQAIADNRSRLKTIRGEIRELCHELNSDSAGYMIGCLFPVAFRAVLSALRALLSERRELMAENETLAASL